MTAGLRYFRISMIEVHQDSTTRIKPMTNFDGAGLHPVMRRNVALAGYNIPTPIQQYCLPAVLLGYDVIAVAQTGKWTSVAVLNMAPGLTFSQRFRKDCCLSDPDPEPSHGQGQEAGSSSAKSGYVSARHRSADSR
jgi:hypothetical protein